jgi:hypothetical protein
MSNKMSISNTKKKNFFFYKQIEHLISITNITKFNNHLEFKEINNINFNYNL